MDISNYNIEQCDAVSVLNAIIDMHDRPVERKLAEFKDSLNQVASDIQAVKDAHILGFSCDGATYETDYKGSTTAEVLINKGHILRLVDNSITSLEGGDITLGMSKCKYAEYNSLTSITSGYSDFSGMGVLEDIELPNLISIIGPRSYFNSSLIKRINIKKLTNTNKFYSNTLVCGNLIDVEYGASINTSSTFLSEWNPTNALLDNSDSLLTDADRTAGFTNNRQKLLWNIRNHIAAYLPTITQNYSITFSSSVKAAILADTATQDAFTDKGWTIA